MQLQSYISYVGEVAELFRECIAQVCQHVNPKHVQAQQFEMDKGNNSASVLQVDFTMA